MTRVLPRITKLNKATGAIQWTINHNPNANVALLNAKINTLKGQWRCRASSNRNGQKNRKIGICAPKK